jgi:hypothetical protein
MLAKFLKHFAETVHQEGQIIVNFLKTAGDIIFFHTQKETLVLYKYRKTGAEAKRENRNSRIYINLRSSVFEDQVPRSALPVALQLSHDRFLTDSERLAIHSEYSE